MGSQPPAHSLDSLSGVDTRKKYALLSQRAQRLARGYSQLIGLCFCDATAAYINEALNGMLDFADQHDYRVGLYRFNPFDVMMLRA